jgi:betaine-aldehyde dehydrogenase
MISAPTLWINGGAVIGQGLEIENIDPALDERLHVYHAASLEQVDQAVTFALLAQKQWAKCPLAERAAILYRTASLLEAHQEELALIEVRETGKPIRDVLKDDLPSAAESLRYFAKASVMLSGQSHHALPNHFFYTSPEPLGICAAMGAWNYPLQIACWKAAPALITGNALLYKASELTPSSAVMLAQLFEKAGLPAGVFQVLLGDAQVGQALVDHPSIAKISLTGSVATGQRVAAHAGGALKKVSLELGGKSPLIIFPSCDLPQAVIGALWGNYYAQGEICSNGTRVFVHQSILEPFIAQIKDSLKKLRLGLPQSPETQMGSLISRAHRDQVLNTIQKAKQAGAECLYGGKIPSEYSRGAFIEPTLFLCHTDSLQIVQEEIFGPVLCVLPFTEEEEVITRANDSPYGLAAGIYTQNITQAHRVAAQLQVGTCWINAYNVYPQGMPFGGYKKSGLGRENALSTLNEYTQIKSIYVGMEPMEHPFVC